ncbi:MAG: cytochrome C, partial [Gammaproteobacteria bacterium]|nr:cytochrome C [Gammaproteobacteria bacterium]
MRLLFKLLMVLTIAVGIYYLLFHYQLSQEPSYITSEKCQSCHQENYTSWKENTLHPYMFRPLTSEDEILGDFESGDPAVTFQKSDVQFLVGNKWEQIYVKMIDGEYYPLPAKWHIMLKKWEP